MDDTPTIVVAETVEQPSAENNIAVQEAAQTAASAEVAAQAADAAIAAAHVAASTAEAEAAVSAQEARLEVEQNESRIVGCETQISNLAATVGMLAGAVETMQATLQSLLTPLPEPEPEPQPQPEPIDPESVVVVPPVQRRRVRLL